MKMMVILQNLQNLQNQKMKKQYQVICFHMCTFFGGNSMKLA